MDGRKFPQRHWAGFNEITPSHINFRKRMPHFILDCSDEVLKLQSPKTIIKAVYEAAEETNLFQKGDIKVRINCYSEYTAGGKDSNFIHVFGNIMEGRTTEQKFSLSRAVVRQLTSLLPDVPIISINIREFEKATYFNRGMLD